MTKASLSTGCILLAALALCDSSTGAPTVAGTDRDLRRDFAEPPQRYWPRPLWFWNNTPVVAETVKDQMRQARDRCRYGGFGILPFGREFRPAYLSDAYFAVYGAALEQAKALGLTLSLYDEYGFPSGSAGSQNSSDTSLFAQRWPELTIKRLDKHEWEVSGPAEFEQTVSGGKLMAVVAMNTATRQRIDLTDTVRAGRLDWQAPAGPWKVMCFVCVIDGDPICDYLDPEAADRFIELTHQAYYERFADHFGTTIDSTFFDEPTLYRAGGRTWTDQFNEKFRTRYGFDPRPCYPALWYDIGPETEAARNYLFGFRAELYATGFTKRIQDWCDAHGITATGHQDQEEVVNPVSVSGDLMKCFQHLDIPGIDKIGGNRPAERFYKIVSSAAYNWDKSLVMSETYGAMGDLGWDAIYTVAMEQYTKGINLLIPHAVWYDDQKVTFKPELSWRSPLYAEKLPEFNTYLARLNVLLQNEAAHVADIAVLYPIATLQGSHHLDGPLGHYQGGVAVPEADYVEVGELLAVHLGRDYTFLHPEVLEEKCILDGGALMLPNRIHPGRFGVMVLPGHKTIRWSSLKRIKAFYEQGGSVIATGLLPSKSAEFGHDDDVVQVVEALFGTTGREVRRNPKGGFAIHLPTLTAETLREALAAVPGTCDVAFESGQALRYIHKRWNGRHVYFFANLNSSLTESVVTLRGRHHLEAWDPHTGTIQPVQATYDMRSGTDFTRIHLSLPHLRSVFLVSSVLPAGEAGTFTNPLNPGPDPWMLSHEGNYYLTTTQGNCLRMWKAPTLAALKTAPPVTVWTDDDPTRSHGIWAPEFHLIDGRWYLYYTAMAATRVDTTHRMHVLESEGADPLGPYHYKGRLFDPNNDLYAIDGSVFQHPGDGYWYFLWAAHPGHRIRIARMANPWTLEGPSVEIPASGFGCEEVREGPVVLRRNGRLFLTYSACDTGKPDYKIGMLVADENGDVMNPDVWEQHPVPVFERNDPAGVFGPGHHGFFQSPDGSEDWIVYHAKTTAEYTYRGRTTRAQKFTWNADGTPSFGKPFSLDTVLAEPSGGTAARSITNPVARSGADPWVIRRGGQYYLCQSRRGAIWVNRAIRLQDIGQDNWRRVWTPPAGTAYSRELWAPELHYLKGKWYIYVAADDGDNQNHRMYVLEGSSADPQDPFTFKGKIAAPTDRWAIDGTVLQMPDGRLYFIWSGWEGMVNVAQHLYIAPMSDPWTICGERVRISSPQLEWELHGEPLINEGPQVLWNRDKLFVIYSASGSWTDDYCLGQLTWTGGDPLDPASWVKQPNAVLARTEDVFGPGHCSFVKSRDNTEDWIVYHSAKHSGAGWNRQVNMQRFIWNPDGSPNFGRPISPGVPMPAPSGDSASE